MKFIQDNPASNEYVFSDYSDHSVTINEQKLVSSLIVFPDALHDHWEVHSVKALMIEHFELLLKRQPDIVILGTGNTQTFPSVDLRRQLAASNIQLDVMSNAAACRIYNLLVSEGRDVAAAIIIDTSTT